MLFPFENMTEIESEDQWHSLRRVHGGSSDAPALFDYGYANKPSAWSVYAQLTGMLPPDNSLDDDDRVWLGKEFEPVISRYVARKRHWDLIPGGKWYVQHPSINIMGATIDNFVLEHEDGIGIVETKVRDWLQFRDDYFDPITGKEAASMRDRIQVAHQLACLPEVKWVSIAVLVGGNELKTFTNHRNDYAELIEDVEKAWLDMTRRLAEKDEPEIGRRELPAWLQAHLEALSIAEPPLIPDDAESFDDLVQTYIDQDSISKTAKKRASDAKAKLLQRMGEHRTATSNQYRVSVTRSDVPASISERKAHVRTTLKAVPYDGQPSTIDPEALAAAMASQAPIDD
jgi:hypothetical protein